MTGLEEYVEPRPTLAGTAGAGGVRFGRKGVPAPVLLAGFSDVSQGFDTEILKCEELIAVEVAIRAAVGPYVKG